MIKGTYTMKSLSPPPPRPFEEALRSAFLERAHQAKISVKVIDREQLVELATQLWQTRNPDKSLGECSELFIDRISVNYIRHELTSYDKYLEIASFCAGVTSALRLLRQRIYIEIVHAYPIYVFECERQLAKRGLLE